MKPLLLASLLLIGGCASVVNGGAQSMALRSVPDAASITITNRSGERIDGGQTPVVLNLKRGWGYFKPESYRVVVAKQGYKPIEFDLEGKVSGWYFGNIVFGSLLGFLVIDPLSGGMYTLSPDVAEKSLAALGIEQAEKDGSITILLAENLPDDMRKQAVPIN